MFRPPAFHEYFNCAHLYDLPTVLSPGQDEDAEASRWQEDTKVTVQQTDDLINLAKKQKKINYFHSQQRIYQGDCSADRRHDGPDDGGGGGGLGARGE